MPCEEVVVYEIPVECGHVYIGQIGRCFDERVLEHEGNTKSKVANSLLTIGILRTAPTALLFGTDAAY